MADIVFSNNASSLLNTTISAVATTIELETGFGARFPNPGVGEYFYATLEDNAGNFEVVQCTARSNDLLTVVRGQDGTTGLTFTQGVTRVELRLCNAVVSEFVQNNGDLMSGDLDFNGNGIVDAVLSGPLTQILNGEIVGVPIRGTSGLSSNEINIVGAGAPTIGGAAILKSGDDIVAELDVAGTITLDSATVGVIVPGGAYLRVAGATAANYLQLAHDDTDVNITGANTTDINFGGITGDIILGAGIDIDMAANDLIRPNFLDFGVQRQVINVTGTPTDLDYEAGSYVELNLSNLANPVTLTFSNPPPSGQMGTMRIKIAQDGTGSKTITWPTINWQAGGPITLSTGANQVDFVDVWTSDGGTTWYGAGANNFA